MAGFSRTKSVTDPLDDKVKARIVGRDRREAFYYYSSGSEHSAGADFDDASPCLSDLVHGFLEDGSEETFALNESASDRDPSVFDSMEDAEDHIITYSLAIDRNADPFKVSVAARVSEAMEMFSCLKSNRSMYRRNVMTFLRDLGYNAGICKTKWESCGGLAAGNYEFIDVVVSDAAGRLIARYVVDLDFAGEFEIARPTSQYEHLLRSLPRIYVGRGEELKHIVKTMSDAAKRSLKSTGLYLPPWRKNRFMQNKWLGPYRRTTSLIPVSFPSWPSSATNQKHGVKCRSVGFHVINDRLFVPATTRTR